MDSKQQWREFAEWLFAMAGTSIALGLFAGLTARTYTTIAG